MITPFNLNNQTQLDAGLKIIDTLSKHRTRLNDELIAATKLDSATMQRALIALAELKLIVQLPSREWMLATASATAGRKFREAQSFASNLNSAVRTTSRRQLEQDNDDDDAQIAGRRLGSDKDYTTLAKKWTSSQPGATVRLDKCLLRHPLLKKKRASQKRRVNLH
jgi:cell division septum initiation protein DivIVA